MAAALLAALPAQAARRALLIGNDDYKYITQLRNAGRDAQDLARALQGMGYDSVDVSNDRDLKGFQAMLRSFNLKVQDGDEVVFFFSGHGVQLGDTNYLLPTDVAGQNAEQVKDDAISLSQLLANLRARQPRLLLAIIDACRDNPFMQVGKSIGVGRGLTGVAGAEGQMVVYAAGEGQQALDRLGPNDTARNGLFTRVLLEEMRQPGVLIRDVIARVRNRVNALAWEARKHRQTPALYDQVVGDFYFLPSRKGDQPPPPPPPERQVLKDCDVCPELVVVPVGSFMMGSPEGEAGRNDNEVQHRVTMGRRYAIGKYEVTQGQWRAVMGANPSVFKDCGDECPVENVSWNDVQAYLRKLNERTGNRYGYRLPSEAEWEYAARGGSKDAYAWGAQVGRGNANCYGCGSRWDIKSTAPVGQFAANAWDLHDMAGNVWEWVQDCYVPYGEAPTDGSAVNPSSCPQRVRRGGSWNFDPQRLRSADRVRISPVIGDDNTGFRVARTF